MPKFHRKRQLRTAGLLIRVLRCAFSGCAFLGVASAGFSSQAEARDGCSPSVLESAAVVSVSERLELTLADGRVLRLAGIEAAAATPDNPDLEARGRDWLKDLLGQQNIRFARLEERPDRWGRLAATVFAAPPEGAPMQPLAEAALEHGFARFMPEPTSLPCEKELLQSEEKARMSRLGLWQDPYYAILKPDNKEGLRDHSASFVLAEGQISEVREAGPRLRVLLGERRRGYLAVTLMQRNVRIFEAAGLHFRDLIGQTLRVRGLLETRFGPEIEVAHRSDIEVIAADRGAAAWPASGAAHGSMD